MQKHLFNKTTVFEYLLITLGSVLYGISTAVFIFPGGLFLGGTSGISLILTKILPFSPGIILLVINFLLLALAFIILGRDMAVKTTVGSALTAIFIALFEKINPFATPLIENPYVSALVGAAIIAIASGIMFYVDSSSGGTDIVALIVKKFSGIQIGTALLITDVLIVVVGGILSKLSIFISSFIGLLVKTLGINLVIFIIKKLMKRKEAAGTAC